MRLSETEFAFLQLVTTKPLKDLSAFHLEIANRLAVLGLVACEDAQWYPTAAGLKVLAHTLH